MTWRVLLFFFLTFAPIAAFAAESLEVSAELGAVLGGRYPRDVAQLRLIEAQVERIAAQAVPATVGVEVGRGSGSGAILNREGLVLTAGHVIGRPGRRATLVLPDGRRLRGRTLGANHEIDAGLVQITEPPDDLPFLPLGTERPPIGAWVVATGQPGGVLDDRSPPVRLGRVLGGEDDWMWTDSVLVGGDSGGPLINMRGEVVGVHSSIGPLVTHNFHVPVVAIKPSWDRLLAGEMWGTPEEDAMTEVRPMLGITGITENEQCTVTHVFPNLAAEAAGVEVDDVVVQMDGVTIKSFEQLSAMVRDRQPGERVRLKLRRGQETLDVRVKLSAVRLPRGR